MFYYHLMIISYLYSAHWRGHHRHLRRRGSVLVWGCLVSATDCHILLHQWHVHLTLGDILPGHDIHVDIGVERWSISLHGRLSVHGLVHREVPYLIHRNHGVHLRVILTSSNLTDEFLDCLLCVCWIFVYLVDQCLSHLRISLHDLLHYKEIIVIINRMSYSQDFARLFIS